jgi:hypothetical protein
MRFVDSIVRSLPLSISLLSISLLSISLLSTVTPRDCAARPAERLCSAAPSAGHDAAWYDAWSIQTGGDAMRGTRGTRGTKMAQQMKIEVQHQTWSEVQGCTLAAWSGRLDRVES